MALDWELARQVGAIGFGVVFGVLSILVAMTWLVGVIVGKIGHGAGETGDKQKGA